MTPKEIKAREIADLEVEIVELSERIKAKKESLKEKLEDFRFMSEGQTTISDHVEGERGQATLVEALAKDPESVVEEEIPLAEVVDEPKEEGEAPSLLEGDEGGT